MIPLLPSNPNTISEIVYSNTEKLRRLRLLDTYYRETSTAREMEKALLEYIIANEKLQQQNEPN